MPGARSTNQGRVPVELCFIFHGVYNGVYTFGRSKKAGIEEEFIGKCIVSDKGGLEGLEGQFCFCHGDHCNDKPASDFELLCYECFHSFMKPDSRCLNGDSLPITLRDNDISKGSGVNVNGAIQVFKSGKSFLLKAVLLI